MRVKVQSTLEPQDGIKEVGTGLITLIDVHIDPSIATPPLRKTFSKAKIGNRLIAKHIKDIDCTLEQIKYKFFVHSFASFLDFPFF